MKKKRRIIPICIAAALFFTAFAGCETSKPPQESISPSPVTQTQSPALENPEVTPRPSPPSFHSGTLMMTIGAKPVYWDELKYWMYDILQNSGFDLTAPIDWAQLVEGIPLSDYLLSEAVSAVSLFRLIELKCGELGVALTEEDQAGMDTFRDECIAQFQSEEEYQTYLDGNFLSQDLLNYMNMVALLYNDLFNELYGAYGEKLSDEDVCAFGSEYSIYRAKHILISNMDEAGNRLSDEQVAANYTKATQLLEQLNASDQPGQLFDTLMNENSEDPGLASYPNGYQFAAGDMDPSFQSAVETLSEYGISGVVEMETYGYTIIMRLPLNPNEPILSDQSGSTLRYIAASSRFQTQLDAWIGELDIKYAPAYDLLNPADWF
jgi:hypothetical protein